MAASTNPVFVDTPDGAFVQISAANTARDGTGTIVTVHTAGADGTHFPLIRIQATVTTTAGVVRIWKRLSAGTWRLLKEILVTAVTPSTTVEAWSFEWQPPKGITLSPTDELGASTHNAETFNIFAEGGGDF